MYSNRQSVMYQWRRRLVRVTRSQNERRLPKTVGSGGGRNRTMYSNQAVAVVSKCPTKGCQERCLLRPSVPATKSPIVDRPLRLREIPAPFTSRSPGIATLGPSCTPSRQLGSVVKLSKAQRRIIETSLFGGPGTPPGCSPDRQLGSSVRPSNEGMVRTSGSG
jgi:hypothetical protein